MWWTPAVHELEQSVNVDCVVVSQLASRLVLKAGSAKPALAPGDVGATVGPRRNLHAVRKLGQDLVRLAAILAEQAHQPERTKRDPISVYLTALESQFEN